MSVAVVGNAPVVIDQGAMIDAASTVIRFNKATGFGAGHGTRTDRLFLINHGGQMAEWLVTDSVFRSAAFEAAGEIVLPVPILNGHIRPGDSADPEGDKDRINHLTAVRPRIARSGKAVCELTAPRYLAIQKLLMDAAPEAGLLYPSTGFIAIADLVLAGRTDIQLHGFTFKGWQGHAWHAERTLVGTWARAGCLTQIEPCERAAA